MKKLIIGLGIGIFFSINLFALSAEAQYDMLKVKLYQQLKDNEYAKVPNTINRIKALGVSTPKSFDYFEGKALFESGKKAQSYAKFEQYVNKNGKSGRYYQESISYLNKAEGPAKKAKIAAKKAAIERVRYTVIDGLMWEDNTHSKTVKLGYNSAKEYCENLIMVGYDDWRLPSYSELKRLHYKKNKLKNLALGVYGSSSGRDIDFSEPIKKGREIYASHAYVRCVRNNVKERDGYRTYTWPNGNKYVGMWKNGKRHGQGTFTYPNGSNYAGMWKNDEKHGKGTHTVANGKGVDKLATGSKYVGMWENGLHSGKGTQFSAGNGRTYVGMWKYNKKHGQGTMTYPDGKKDIGTWKNDKFIGQSTNISSNSKKSGQGEIAWPDGQKYIGMIENGEMNGQGTITYANNAGKYIGMWKYNKRHGQGTEETWPSGHKYVGMWKDDKKNGQGTYTWPDGQKYIGMHENNKMTGQGTMTYPDGQKYEGMWKDDKRNGQGIHTWPSGHKYVGMFENNKMNGQGTMTYPDGKKNIGTWENNKFINR